MSTPTYTGLAIFFLLIVGNFVFATGLRVIMTLIGFPPSMLAVYTILGVSVAYNIFSIIYSWILCEALTQPNRKSLRTLIAAYALASAGSTLLFGVLSPIKLLFIFSINLFIY